MNALTGLGVKESDRVGTFGQNTYRHLEAYFAAPFMGGVVHTVNTRLAPDDLCYTINHAGDKVLLVDEDLLPIIGAISPSLDTVAHLVVMTDKSQLISNRPSARLYEEMISQASDVFEYPLIKEKTAAELCYTLATTGRPQEVTYTHSGIYLQTMMECLKYTFALSERDVILSVVPMFHANTWHAPYACAFLASYFQVSDPTQKRYVGLCRARV